MDFRQRPWPAERRRRRNGPRPPIRRRHVILNARNLPPAITASRRERRRRRNGPCPPTRRRHIILNARSLPPARTLNRKTSAVDTEVQPLEVGGVRETTVLAKEDNQDHNELVTRPLVLSRPRQKSGSRPLVNCHVLPLDQSRNRRSSGCQRRCSTSN
jgi:hypothetical protein